MFIFNGLWDEVSERRWFDGFVKMFHFVCAWKSVGHFIRFFLWELVGAVKRFLYWAFEKCGKFNQARWFRIAKEDFNLVIFWAQRYYLIWNRQRMEKEDARALKIHTKINKSIESSKKLLPVKINLEKWMKNTWIVFYGTRKNYFIKFKRREK